MYIFLSESEFEEDDFNSDVMMTMTETFDPSYTLYSKSMREAQLNNESLNEIVKKHLSSSGKNNTLYTYKTVEEVKLVHKNNQIFVPQSKQQSALHWYHKILINPCENV